MDPILFFALPAVVAAGSAMVCYVLMQARMDVAVARERTERARTEARLEMLEETIPERLKAAENSLMSGLRVEERRLVRERGTGNAPALVLQERLYFRNIPLSNWIEHELTASDAGSEVTSVFTQPQLRLEAPPAAAPAQQTAPAPKRPQLIHSARRAAV